MAADPIRFYFDYISPNAYLAWARIHAAVRSSGRPVDPVPVLFAGLLSASKRPGPAEVPPMWRWMVRNVLRKAALHGVPMRAPASHPFNPLLALRVSSLPMDPDRRGRVIDALFRAVWAEGKDVADGAQVARLLSDAGLDGDRAVREAVSRQGKDRLRLQTEQAVTSGVFGVPTMIADGECFWGHDDLDFLARFLEGRDPLPRGECAAWDALRPTAWRRDAPGRRPD